HHRWLPPPADCPRRGGAGPGRQPADEAVPRYAADDEEHEGRQAAAAARGPQGWTSAGNASRQHEPVTQAHGGAPPPQVALKARLETRRIRALFWVVPQEPPATIESETKHGDYSP